MIITNNGQQFDNYQKFKKFCVKYHLTHKLTLVGHSQSNGEVKVTNQMILHDLKTRLNEAKGL